MEIPLESLKWENGSQIFAHVIVARSESVARNEWDHTHAFQIVRPLVKYLPKKKVVKVKKLLGGGKEDEEKEKEVEEVVPEQTGPTTAAYWHSNFTLETIDNAEELAYRSIPGVLRQHVALEASGARDATGQNGWYYPIFFENQFWQLKEHMFEINDTVK